MITFATAKLGELPFIKGDNPELAKQLRRSDEVLRRRHQSEKRKLERQAEREQRQREQEQAIAEFVARNADDPTTPAYVDDMLLNNAETEEETRALLKQGIRDRIARFLPQELDPYQIRDDESDGEFWERLEAMVAYDVVNPSQTQPQTMFPCKWRGTPTTTKRQSLAAQVEPCEYHQPKWHFRQGGPISYLHDNGSPPPAYVPAEIDFTQLDIRGVVGRGLIRNGRQTTYPAIESYRIRQAITKAYSLAVERVFMVRIGNDQHVTAWSEVREF